MVKVVKRASMVETGRVWQKVSELMSEYGKV